MLIHASGWNPSARSIQSHRIRSDWSYTIHEATSEPTIQIAGSPVAAYSAARAAGFSGRRLMASVARTTAHVAPA